jgi:threonine/homoserine/homoserine lactone efflux protein
MNFKERFGCFCFAVGLVTLMLFGMPIVGAFQKDPSALPEEWIAAAGIALLILWIGWRLYSSGRKAAESQKPPSLGARIAGRWKSDEKEKGR